MINLSIILRLYVENVENEMKNPFRNFTKNLNLQYIYIYFFTKGQNIYLNIDMFNVINSSTVSS